MSFKYLPPDKLNKLLVISKSKFNTFNFCPHAFMLGYIGEIPREPSVAMEMGSRVHKFHEDFFKSIDFSLVSNNLMFTGKFTDINGVYEKNIVEHYTKMWNKLGLYPTEQRMQYFLPKFVEEMIIIENEQIKGIPDALFEDPNLGLMTFELKTGIPTPKKIDNYKEDLIWYKILVEAQSNGDVQITHGKIYFPINNLDVVHRLRSEDALDLLKRVSEVREKIRSCSFEPSPSNQKCSMCGFRTACEFNELK